MLATPQGILCVSRSVKKLSPPTSIPEKPVFVWFNDEDVWRVPGYRRNLPHWRVEGATYFVTFRLNDSIPANVAELWREEDRRWLRDHGIDIAWRDEESERFDTALRSLPKEERSAYQRRHVRRQLVEVDRCHGECLMRKSEIRDLVSGALRYFHGQRVWLGDFVVMPNHVHVLVQPLPGIVLEEWLYSVKRFSGSRMGNSYEQVWQEESLDRVIRDVLELRRVREYIARNPVKLRDGWYSLERAAWMDERMPK
jgi:putative transposase